MPATEVHAFYEADYKSFESAPVVDEFDKKNLKKTVSIFI